ncbi:hypothetical protein H4R22_001081 [Coemansia sp. RSA 1290]|nr:hypothetical protein H4R22_001081 [Coemansia sp. RSA 1290]
MFGPRNIRGHTVVQNKENDVPGSVSRSGKAGLLSSKDALASSHPMKKTANSAVFGNSATNTATPRPKQMDGKQQQNARMGLREITQTPSALARASKPTPAQSQVPRTIKRRQGLFSPSNPSTAPSSTPSFTELLEPEYVPAAVSSYQLDPIDEFGCDLDIGMVPLTQSSFITMQARDISEPSLEPELLVCIPDTPPLDFPSLPDDLPMEPISCKPTTLIAHSLYPSRIPRLKRKR